jgi:hypothetical protein
MRFVWECFDRFAACEEAVFEPVYVTVFGDSACDDDGGSDTFHDGSTMVESSTLSTDRVSDESFLEVATDASIEYPRRDPFPWAADSVTTVPYDEKVSPRDEIMTACDEDDDDDASFSTACEHDDSGPWDEAGCIAKAAHSRTCDVVMKSEKENTTAEPDARTVFEELNGTSPVLKRRMRWAFTKIRTAVEQQRPISPILSELARLEEMFLEDIGETRSSHVRDEIVLSDEECSAISERAHECSSQGVVSTVFASPPSVTASSESEELSMSESLESSPVQQMDTTAQHMMMNIDLAFARNQCDAAIAIQRIARGFLARLMARAKLHVLMQDTAVLIIQDAWLSYVLRKRCTTNVKQGHASCGPLQTDRCHDPPSVEAVSDEASPEWTCQASMANPSYTVLRATSYPGTFSYSHKQCMRDSSLLDLDFDDEEEGEDENILAIKNSLGSLLDQNGCEMGPKRKLFHRHRIMAVSALPIISEEPEHKASPKDRPRCSALGTEVPIKNGEDHGSCEELEILDTQITYPEGLVPPPQVRRRMDFPTVPVKSWPLSQIHYQHRTQPLQTGSLSASRAHEESSRNAATFSAAVTVIQSRIRTHLGRQKHDKSAQSSPALTLSKAATSIQSLVRGYRERQSYQNLLKTVVVVQEWARAVLLARRLRLEAMRISTRSRTHKQVKPVSGDESNSNARTRPEEDQSVDLVFVCDGSVRNTRENGQVQPKRTRRRGRGRVRKRKKGKGFH